MGAVTIVPGIERSGGHVAHWAETTLAERGPFSPASVPALAEAAVAGLAPGIRVATARGFRRIEALEPGERVMTRDNGFATVLEVWRRRVAAGAVVTLRAGAVRGLNGDVMLGGGQGVLWTGSRVAETLGTREGFLRACDIEMERAAVDGFVTLFLPVLERQEVIFADGLAVATALPAGGVPARRLMSQDEARRVLRA